MTLVSLVTTVLLMQAAPVHTTHYPRHGGQFFTAAGDTLHLEVIWPSPRVLKLYVYDEEARPLPLERLRQVSGRLIAGGVRSPLVLREREALFEMRLPVVSVTTHLSLELTPSNGASPETFQFAFADYTDESVLKVAHEPTPIPETLDATLEALLDDVRDADGLIERRQSAYVFAPAVRARDHALALERFLPQLGDVRPRAEAAIREVVRVAWLLHIATDEGTPAQVEGALDELSRLIAELVPVFTRAAR